MNSLFNIISQRAVPTDSSCLSIRVGAHHLAFILKQRGSGVVEQISYYTFQQLISNEFINELPSSNEVIVVSDYTSAMLVPAHKWELPVAAGVLKEIYGVDEEDRIFKDSIGEWQLDIVHGLPVDIFSKINERYPHAKFFHGYTIALRNLSPVTVHENYLQVDFRTDEIVLIAIKDSKVLLVQTYEYETPADVIYILLNTCEQFGFLQETVKISITGLIDQQSALFTNLYQYFIHVEFRNVEWELSEDQQLPHHYFTTLNDATQCE